MILKSVYEYYANGIAQTRYQYIKIRTNLLHFWNSRLGGFPESEETLRRTSLLLVGWEAVDLIIS